MMKGNIVSVTVKIKISLVIYSHFKGLFLGAGKMIKCWPCKHEEWILVPSTHVKARCYKEANWRDVNIGLGVETEPGLYYLA